MALQLLNPVISFSFCIRWHCKMLSCAHEFLRPVTEWHSSKQGTFEYSHTDMNGCRQISDFLPRQSDFRTPPTPLLWRDPRLQQSTFFLTGTPDVKDRWEMERGQEAGEKRHWGRSLAGFYTEAKAHEIKDDHPAVRNRALLAYFGPLWVPIETCYKAYASCQSEQPRALWDHWWNMDNGVQGGHKGRQAT